MKKIHHDNSCYKKTTLSNGLTIGYKQIKGLPYVRVVIIVHSGAKEDKISGTANLIANLLAFNTKRNYNDIKNFARDLGGDIKLIGSTSLLTTEYELLLPIEGLEEWLDIFGDMLLNCVITKEISNKIEVIKDEQKRIYRTSLLSYTEDKAVYQSLLPEDHWLTKNFCILGGQTESDLYCIEKEQLQSFYDEHYVPANISIVCSGGHWQRKTIIDLINKSVFGTSNKQGKRNSIPSNRELHNPKVGKFEFNHYSAFNAGHGQCLIIKCLLPTETSNLAIKIAFTAIKDHLEDKLENLVTPVVIGDKFEQMNVEPVEPQLKKLIKSKQIGMSSLHLGEFKLVTITTLVISDLEIDIENMFESWLIEAKNNSTLFERAKHSVINSEKMQELSEKTFLQKVIDSITFPTEIIKQHPDDSFEYYQSVIDYFKKDHCVNTLIVF